LGGMTQEKITEIKLKLRKKKMSSIGSEIEDINAKAKKVVFVQRIPLVFEFALFYLQKNYRH
jgi:hypothetical protein